MLAGCDLPGSIATIDISRGSATCSATLRSGHITGPATIDFTATTATVAEGGVTYKGDVHPLFSNTGSAGQQTDVSVSGDVSDTGGHKKHVTGKLACKPSPASRTIADVSFGTLTNSTCASGSIPRGFGLAYAVAANADGSTSFTPTAEADKYPALKGVVVGAMLHLVGDNGTIAETMDIEQDPALPANGKGTLHFALTTSGQRCTADYAVVATFSGP